MRRTLSAVVVCVVAAGTATVGPAAASSAPCSGTDSSFCVSYDVGVIPPGTTTAVDSAASPADVSLSFANSSAGLDSSTSRWLNEVDLSLVNGLGPVNTSSNDLDPGLLVAGSSEACGSGGDFTSCTAGHGTFYADLTGTVV